MSERDLGITFAGGGNRAFYQLGLMNVLGSKLSSRVAAMSACSAGACVAIVLLSGRQAETHEFWKQRRGGVTKNFEWRRLLRGRRPTPHAPIYRDTVLFALGGGGLERIQSLTHPLYVLASRFSPLLPAAAAAALGLSAYSLERRLHPLRLHPTFGKRVGFSAAAFDARDCKSADELADLVIASSATPPFTPIGRFRDQPLLDGGLVDNAPASLVESVPGVKKNLVLLTRPHAELPSHAQRLYLAPSRAVPVERWDYTRPELVDATIAMGRSEADTHRASVEDFLRR